MRSSSRSSAVIVADPDSSTLEELQRQSGSGLHLVTVRSVEALSQALASPPGTVAAVFLNPSLSGKPDRGLSLVRLVHERRPVTPLFLMQDGDAAKAPWNPKTQREQLREAGVLEVLQKPLSAPDLLSRAGPPLELGLAPPELPDPVLGSAATGQGATDDYQAVSAGEFVGRSESLFDVYLKLASGHYVKILRAGDFFAAEQLRKYRERGVRDLYLRRTDVQRMLHACQTLAGAVNRSPETTLAARVEATILYGDAVVQALKACGVKDEQISHARRFAAQVDRVVDRLALRERPVIREFLKDAASAEHGVGATLVAALLCEACDVNDRIAVEVVGLSALVHDVGLYQMPPEAQEEDESRMGEPLRQKYRSHPIIGAQLLQAAQGVETAVIDAVVQHHERRNLKGFPVHFGVSRVNRLSEIVALADEFQRVLASGTPDPMARMEASYDGFSKALVTAFKEYFINTLR